MPKLEVVIALLRNGACVVKSVLAPAHWAMQPCGYGDGITYVEATIAPLQFAAVLYNLSASLPFLSASVASWVSSSAPSEAQWSQAIATNAASVSPLAVQFAQVTLAADMAAARQKTKVMFCKMLIGGAFITLCLSSLHKPFPAVINWAVLLLEFALVYLLTVMLGGVMSGRQRAGDAKRLATALETKDFKPLQSPAAMPLLKLAAGQVQGGNSGSLPETPWSSSPPATDPFGVESTKTYLQALTKHETDLRALAVKAGTREALSAALASASQAQAYNTALDFVAMLCNSVAWCGYGMFPLTYFNTDANLKAYIPIWPGRDFAQYWGNLAGDAAWTVEPLLLIVVPSLIESAVAKAKVKTA